MEIGDKENAKYVVTINTVAYAYKVAGRVYCNSKDELDTLIDENFDALHENGHISTNISNDFEIEDYEIDFNNLPSKEDLEKYYSND